MITLTIFLLIAAGALIILTGVVCEMWGNIVKLRNQMAELISKYELTELMDLPQLVEYLEKHPLKPVLDNEQNITYKRK